MTEGVLTMAHFAVYTMIENRGPIQLTPTESKRGAEQGPLEDPQIIRSACLKEALVGSVRGSHRRIGLQAAAQLQ